MLMHHGHGDRQSETGRRDRRVSGAATVNSWSALLAYFPHELLGSADVHHLTHTCLYSPVSCKSDATKYTHDHVRGHGHGHAHGRGHGHGHAHAHVHGHGAHAHATWSWSCMVMVMLMLMFMQVG